MVKGPDFVEQSGVVSVLGVLVVDVLVFFVLLGGYGHVVVESALGQLNGVLPGWVHVTFWSAGDLQHPVGGALGRHFSVDFLRVGKLFVQRR